MADDLTVLLVGSFGPSDELSGLLEKQGIFGDTVAPEELGKMLQLAEPALVVHFGQEGAERTVARLQSLETAERRLRVVIIAERSALAELRKLDRTFVASLLATDMPDGVIATRIAMLARKGSAKTIPPGSKAAVKPGAAPPRGKTPPPTPTQAAAQAAVLPGRPKAPPRIQQSAQAGAPRPPLPSLSRQAPPPTASLPPRPGTSTPPPSAVASPAAAAVKQPPVKGSPAEAPPDQAPSSTDLSGKSTKQPPPSPNALRPKASAETDAAPVTDEQSSFTDGQVSFTEGQAQLKEVSSEQAASTPTPTPAQEQVALAPAPPELPEAVSVDPRSKRTVRALVADDDITRGDHIAQALRERQVSTLLVPLDPAATRWPLLRQFEPTLLIVDGSALKRHGQVWHQLFQADKQLGRVRLCSVIFNRMFDEDTGAVDLRMLIPQIPQLSQDAVRDPLPTIGMRKPEDENDAWGIEADSERPTWVQDELSPADLAPRPAVAPVLPDFDPDHELTVIQKGLPELGKKPLASDTPRPTATSKPAQETSPTKSKTPLLIAALVLGGLAGAGYFLRDPLLTMMSGPAPTPTAQAASVAEGLAAPQAAPAASAAPTEAAVLTQEAPQDSPNAPASPWRVALEKPVPSCEELVQNLEELKPGGQGQANLSFATARKALVLGDVDKAHRLLCEGALLQPQSLAVEGLVELLLLKHAPENAKRWISEDLSVRPDRRKALELHGDVLSQLADPDQARKVWAKSLQVDPTDQKTLSIVGQQFEAEGEKALRAGDLPRAEQMLRRAVTLNPLAASGLAKLGQLFLEQFHKTQQAQRKELAKQWAEAALVQQKDFGPALVLLADLKELSGETEAAIELYQQALLTDPQNPRANQQLYKLKNN